MKQVAEETVFIGDVHGHAPTLVGLLDQVGWKQRDGRLANPGGQHLVFVGDLIDHPKQWLRQVQGTESVYYRAIGSAEALMAKAEALGQAWMKGISGELARKILRERPT